MTVTQSGDPTLVPASADIATLLEDIAAYQRDTGASDYAISEYLFRRGDKLRRLRDGGDIHTATLATAVVRLARLREAAR